MTKTVDLSKYLRSGQELLTAPSRAPAVESGRVKRPYEAYRLSKEAKRHLEIRLKFPGGSECPLNSMITNLQGEWRWGQGVTVIYGSSMIVDIKGERLQELIEALKDWKVQWMEAFDPEFHLPPSDDNAPFISSIEITTERPETPPPPHQRH